VFVNHELSERKEFLMSRNAKTVPVGVRALIQRINRRLGSDNEVLKKSRGARAQQDLGDYYVIDVSVGAVCHKDVDLEQFGRKLEVLNTWERVEHES
jgi:hypothetical protein